MEHDSESPTSKLSDRQRPRKEVKGSRHRWPWWLGMLVALSVLAVINQVWATLALLLVLLAFCLVVITLSESRPIRLAAALAMLPICMGAGLVVAWIQIEAESSEQHEARKRQAGLRAFEADTACDPQEAQVLSVNFKSGATRVRGCGSERVYCMQVYGSRGTEELLYFGHDCTASYNEHAP